LKILLQILIFIILSFSSSSQDVHTVIRVIDGDTIVLVNGEKVRLIGVDSPEKNHPDKPIEYFSLEAMEYTKSRLLNKQVRLEYDWEQRDKYNRILAYIYLEDSTLFNLELIETGYAFALTKFPFKHKDQFIEAEQKAKAKGIGIWKNFGLLEYYWLIDNDRSPVGFHQMTNNTWGLKYRKYFLPRISKDSIITVLDSLKIWINQNSEDDLKEILLKNKWQIIER